MESSELSILAQSDPKLQTELESEAVVDELDAEQTWPSEQELLDAESMNFFENFRRNVFQF